MTENQFPPSALEITDARDAAQRLLEEMGLRAFLYSVEPKEGNWGLRIGCSLGEGWQESTLAVNPAQLRATLSNPVLRTKMREDWEARLKACARRGPGFTPRWELYAHAADMGVRGFGATVAEAFEQAALAMTAVITDPALVEPREQVSIECEATDNERMLVDWLNCLVFEMATRRMLFSRFRIRVEGTRLSAQAWGEATDVSRHHPAVEVKGATYTTLRVAREGGGWMAQTVVDV